MLFSSRAAAPAIRHSFLALLLVFLLLLSVPVGTVGAVVDTPPNLLDDRSRSTRLDSPARRIISPFPSIIELVYAAGAGDRPVAVSSHSDYPEAAKSVAEIGGMAGLDLERMVMLKPDLVMAWRSGNAVADIERLEKLGLTIFAVEATRLEDIPRLLRLSGKLAGTSAQAESAASAYEAA